MRGAPQPVRAEDPEGSGRSMAAVAGLGIHDRHGPLVRRGPAARNGRQVHSGHGESNTHGSSGDVDRTR
eukprot:2261669-Heterocapsa_arctica.AAC.1